METNLKQCKKGDMKEKMLGSFIFVVFLLLPLLLSSSSSWFFIFKNFIPFFIKSLRQTAIALYQDLNMSANKMTLWRNEGKMENCWKNAFWGIKPSKNKCSAPTLLIINGYLFMSSPFYMLFLHWKLSEYGSFNFTPPSAF